MDEARLVQLARGGDADAFARLYDACFERVYRYIYFRVSDDQTAEDLTSQVFLKAWEHLDRYKPGSSPFLAWLYTIARNQVIDHYRTRKESVSLDDVVSLPANGRAVDEQVEMRFELKSMRDALKYLTEEQQEVLVLRFIADLTTEEIARMMGKQAGAIRALQMRGLHTLSKYLDKEKLA
jgi:RNA polymerase sigma-70 factor (ECF subfamily)